jgi:membrane protein
MWTIAGRLKEAYARFRADEGAVRAAAIAYYAALSFFPLLLLLISGIGLFLQFTHLGKNAESQLLDIIGSYSSPHLSNQIAQALQKVQRNAVLGAPLGVVGLLLAAAGLFIQLESAFDRIWGYQPRSRGVLAAIRGAFVDRLQAFLTLLGLGLLLIGILLSTVVLTSLRSQASEYVPGIAVFWQILQVPLAIIINSLVFTVVYKVFSKSHLEWSAAVQGGVLAGIVWEIGKWILAGVLIGTKYDVYGVVGALLAVMLWTYYGSLVLFFGAEYVQTVCRSCNTATPNESGEPLPEVAVQKKTRS